MRLLPQKGSPRVLHPTPVYRNAVGKEVAREVLGASAVERALTKKSVGELPERST
jgi:hypothetical protein